MTRCIWLVLAIGCQDPQDPKEPGEPEVPLDPAPTGSTTADADCARSTMDGAGGTITHGDATVDIPVDALAAEVEVELCLVDAPAGSDPASDVVSLGPPGLTLAVPATVRMAHTGNNSTTLFTPDPDGVAVRQLHATTLEDDRIEGPMYRPGITFAAEDDRLQVPYTASSEAAFDLLVVVDNSCSMQDEQAQLAQNFGVVFGLVSGSGLDYHIGVTSTDIDGHYNGSRGKLREANGSKWIDPNTPTPEAVFASMVSLGTSGSGNEKGIGAAYLALDQEADAANAGFLRDGAELGVLVVSDEPDLTPASVITTGEFVDWFEGVKPDPEATTFHTIAHPQYGQRYIDITNAVGGELQNVTLDNWSQTLADIVDGFGALAGMPLAPPAIEGSVEVWSVPLDGSEPVPVDPASVTFDPVAQRVTVAEEAVPDPTVAELVVLYLRDP